MSKYTVVVTDYVFPNLNIERDELGRIDAELVVCKSSDEETIIREAGNADAVLTCYAKMTGRIIDALQTCKVISRYGIGVDNVDIATATRNGIAVTCVPDYCVEEVSDHALSLILSSVRKICQLNQTVHRGTWDFKAYRPIRRLQGQTLGLIGFGKIPRRLVEKVQAFDFQILVYDPYVHDASSNLGVEIVSLQRLLTESDIVSIHAPLTDETRQMLGFEELKMMKKDAFLINTARGGLIDEPGLVAALEKNLIAGAALDVLQSEQLNPDNPLLQMENVVITPHTGFYSEQSLVELQTKAVREVIRVLTGQKPNTCVNPEVLDVDHDRITGE
jgi:D-3-phosphoglycerate dehydrogenase / 2-oxoglutarate reductase